MELSLLSGFRGNYMRHWGKSFLENSVLWINYIQNL
jgi:hypothetical protein